MITKEQVMEKLKEVLDPEIGMNIVEMKLIKEIKIKDFDIYVKMTLTSPFCPLAAFIVEDVKQKLKSIKGVKKVNVEVVF